MDVETVLTLRLIGFLDDDSVVLFSSVCRTTISIVLRLRDAIVSRALLSLMSLLEDHMGGDTTDEMDFVDGAIEAELFWRSVANEWGSDDD